MIRYIFTNNVFLIGFCFLIIFAGLCYLWYQHTIESYNHELLETTDAILQLGMSENVQESAQTETPTTKGSVSLARMSVPTESPAVKAGKISRDVKQNETTPPTQKPHPKTDKVRVSPHGFGPYPEIPSDYPRQDLWDYPDFLKADHELLLRVQIKLWKQDIRTIGGGFIDGRVYPNIPDTVYVKWENRVRPDGTVERYASRISGDPYAGKVIRKIIDTKGKIYEEDIPAGIQVIESDEGGIDPYQFLDLK